MSSPSENPLRNLIREIHRRSLWQVLGIYVVSGWVVYEVVQSLTEGLGLPTWFPAFAFVLLLIGLPIVLATAFVQEGGPGADDESESAASTPESEEGAPSRLFTWKNALLGGVAAFALWGVLAAGWVLFGGEGLVATSGSYGATESSPSVGQSVAVLPFDNLSDDPEQQYFSDGVADQILNALTRIPDLKVTARTSAFAFRDSDLDIRTIADSLGVATVLDGTVQRADTRVRITAQLIEATTGFHLWSETYDRELTDIFAIQDDVARRIAERLRVELGDVERDRLAGPATESTEAHDHYLRGRQLLYQRTPSGIRAAIDAFQQSVQADPSYAPAYAGLAAAYSLGEDYSAAPPGSSYMWMGRSLAYAERAVELGPGLGETHAARGLAGTGGPLCAAPNAPADRAEQDFLRAIELQPSLADALGWYANLLSCLGRYEEALKLQEDAIELDPVSPGRRMGFALSALWAGRPALALEQIDRARSIQPNIEGVARSFETQALLLLDRAEECVQLPPTFPAYQAMCYHDLGRVEAAEETIDSLTAIWTPDRPWWETDGLVSYYAWTGQVDETLAWLDRGLEQSSHLPASAMFPPGIWEPVLAEDAERVHQEVDRLSNAAWHRIVLNRDRQEALVP